MQRKLTAILSADVFGYGGLMEADETGTLERLKANRSAIFDPLVATHGGRVFKLMGDGALAEFSSVVAAVACALAIQAETEKAAQDLSPAKPIRYRIGVNLGDVIIDGDDVYGEGVNVAARIQMLAPVGGVAVSRAVRDQVKGKVSREFDDKGEHKLKNIETPVHLFVARIGSEASTVSHQPGTRLAAVAISAMALWHGLEVKIGRAWLLVAVAVLIVLAAATGFLVSRERDSGGGNSKNAVAVLPFDNLGDARATYLSEGVSDELRNALMHVPDLHVLAPDSSRAFRNAPLETLKIAANLKVGQLVEGSFQKQAGRLRVSVQIVDGATGFQTWSQAFEVSDGDILKLQQAIAAAVATALTGRADASRQLAPPPSLNLSAYDALLLARNYEQQVRDAQVVDTAKLAKAIAFYRIAVKADPGSALAHSRLAGTLLYAGNAEEAEGEIKRAIALNPDLSEVQYTLALYDFARNLPGVIKAYERAVALNPNNVDALAGLAYRDWSFSPRPLKSTEGLFRRALALDPMSLRRYSDLGYFYGVTGQRLKAFALVQEIASRFPDPPGLSVIAQVLEQTGDFDLAIGFAKKALKNAPQNRDTKAQLAELYAEIGDFAAAARYEPEPGLAQLFWRRDYRKLTDLAQDIALERPEETQVWYLLGFAYAARGDNDNAVRVLKIAGLPGRAQSEVTVGNDTAAMLTLAAALRESGAPDAARADAEFVERTARRFADTGADQGTWSNTLLSCALAILGKDDEAMAAFSRVNNGPGLPRLPWLKDQLCFKRFAGDPRYVAVIQAVEKRQADLRRRAAAL